MENIWAIITRADNIPIVGLSILLLFFTGITFAQAFKNDKQAKRRRGKNGE
ncbi:MAG: hypothetical protein U0586_06740 [Candidatus Brocadiaceae bacterium]